MLKTLFEEDAVDLGKQAGLRRRTMSFTQLAWLLVLGWWKLPGAGPSALARFAGSLGLTRCKQTVDCHLTERTASWLLALLQRAVEYVVCAGGIDLPLLQRFTAVYLEDGSSVSLPSVLKAVWGGCGGSPASRGNDPKNQAALKITVRWDLLSGRLHGPYLQEGRRHELKSVLRAQQMLAGSLWIADLGYWTLQWLQQLSEQGVFFLMRYKAGITLWEGKERLDLLARLPAITAERLQLRVDVGADRKLKGARLLAERVPPEVARQRQERIKEAACKHSKPVNPEVMQLANWTLLLTTVPAHLLSFEQAFARLWARWQIELLFKLWKQDGLLDTFSSNNPWHVLCQVYATLLAMVVQHWFVLLSCWDDPHHSLPAVCEVLREQIPTLLHGLTARLPLQRALGWMLQSVRGQCCIPQRRTRLSTSRLLQSGLDPGLT